MAGSGKISFYLIFVVMIFGTIGLISFQTLKERKNSSILLVAKYKEIDNLNNQYENLLKATKETLLQAKEEKESLILKVKNLENNNLINHDICEEDKQKCKIQMQEEVKKFKEMLQTKDIELANANAKIEFLKPNNKKTDTKMDIKTISKDKLLEEDIESFVKTLNIKDENSKDSLSLKPIKREKINGAQSIIDERNIVIQAKVEDIKTNDDYEVDQRNRVNFEENEIPISKVVEIDDKEKFEVSRVVEEDNAKKIEKLKDFDVEGTNESPLQE